MRYKLFRVITPDHQETLILAESEPHAAEIYACTYDLADGEHRLFKISRWQHELAPAQREAIMGYLEFGPNGVATWSDAGWLVRAPA